MFRGGRSIFPVKDEIERGKKICRYHKERKENVSSIVLDFFFSIHDIIIILIFFTIKKCSITFIYFL